MNQVLGEDKFFKILFIFIIVLNSGHSFQTTSNMTKVMLIVTIPLFVFKYFKNINLIYIKQKMILLLIILMMLSFKIYFDKIEINSYLTLILLVSSGFLFSIIFSLASAIKLFRKTIIALSFISLIFYPLINLLNLTNYFYSFFNYNWIKYYSIGLFGYLDLIPFRNAGPFWEPGIFASYVLMATYIELFFVDKCNCKIIILYCITIITTLSLISLVMFFILIIFYILQKYTFDNPRTKRNILYGLGLLLILYVFLHTSPINNNEFIKKILLNNLIRNARTKGMVFNLDMFFSSPIIGNGIGLIKENSKVGNVFYDISSQFFLLNLFGFLGLAINFLLISPAFFLNNNYKKISYILLIVFILNKEPHFQFLIFWYFVFINMDNIKLPVKFKNKETTF